MQLYAPIDICRVIKDNGISYEWVVNPSKPIIEVGSSNIITYDIKIGKVIRDVTIKFDSEPDQFTEQKLPPSYEETPYFEFSRNSESNSVQENIILNLRTNEQIEAENFYDSLNYSEENRFDYEIGLNGGNDYEIISNDSVEHENENIINNDCIDENIPIISSIYNSIVNDNLK
ncbi:hypothetical protein AYI68_g6848 [Smittium mucronatum]|uniref:Uncharacterized protein n=1 Tax=Smittium mucronatum TaxID=133383 RepID=A0A1R0GQE9_9FUNG|nr:hypothetical protein AYI68_g6848 [Smittium mucronatum]